MVLAKFCAFCDSELSHNGENWYKSPVGAMHDSCQRAYTRRLNEYCWGLEDGLFSKDELMKREGEDRWQRLYSNEVPRDK